MGGLCAAPAGAQGPDAEWRTIETACCRVHYPAPAGEWAERAAARLDAILERVEGEVGFAPAERIEILVADPAAAANGFAWAILRRPRLVLWTTPPGAASFLGHERDWTELLATHELAHLAHLTRPSRHPSWRLLGRVVPIGPLVRRAPRWVMEGYATLLEGALTGSGRPHGDLRAAVLRRWAQQGELPTYGELDGGERRFLGASMAYLAGSAYLEWLEGRAGPASLRDLWARMSARRGRDFEEAFAGVFGDRPDRLYRRFTAELTYRAMTAEAALGGVVQQGEPFQDLSWRTGAPAVSADGSRLAIVLRGRLAPSRLVVWSTGPDDEAKEKDAERIAEILRRDPEDVAPVRLRPLAREPLHELAMPDGADADGLRWEAGGASLLFARREPDPRGDLHSDLFRWTPESGRVERLTRAADLFAPDPAPGGGWAVALRARWGKTAIVRVDLESGAVTELVPAALDPVLDSPRLSPDGRRLAYLRHAADGWRLVVRELEGGAETVLPSPNGGTVSDPAWLDDRSLVATVGAEGFLDLHRFDLATEPPSVARLTRTPGAAFAASPAPDALYFLALEPDGLDLRRLPLPAAAARDLAVDPGWAPAVRPPAIVAPPSPAAATLEPSRPYGAGPREWQGLVGGAWSPGRRTFEAGVRNGDPVGRLEVVALGGAGEGEDGAVVSLGWRGLPVELGARLFAVDERPSESRAEVPGLGAGLDARRRGLAVEAGWERRGRLRRLRLAVDAAAGETDLRGDSGLELLAAGLHLDLAVGQLRGRWRLGQRFSADLEAGRTGDEGWRRYGGALRLTAGRRDGPALGVEGAWREADGGLGVDRLQVGGLASTLLPPLLDGARLAVPALAPGALRGDAYRGLRLDLGRGPWTAFWERHEVRRGAAPGVLRLAGLAATYHLDRLPLLGLPALDATAGVAVVLDPPFEDDVEGWVSVAWRP